MIYKSCDWINGGLDFRPNSIVLCCFSFMQGFDDYELVPNYFGGKIDWVNYLKKNMNLLTFKKIINLSILAEIVFILKKGTGKMMIALIV